MTTARRTAFAVAGLLAVATVGPAAAHPHVFVDARAEIVFDKTGEVTAIRHIWQFDEAFTAFAIQGLDANHDGKLSDAELAPLAKVNVDSLKEYSFFTWLRQGKKSYSFVPPTEYWLEFHGGRLTLFYTLPLKQPVAIHGRASLEVFDPEYFVAFTFPKNKAVTLTNAPAGCAAEYHPPHMLDSKTMAMLSAIPADQHDLPPELQDAAAGLANLISLNCTGSPDDAPAADPFEAVMAGDSNRPAAAAPAGDGQTAALPPARPAVSSHGTLTPADIAAAPSGNAQVAAADAAPAAPPPAAVAPAQPAQLPPASTVAESQPTTPASTPASAETATSESSTSEIIAIVLAALFAGGIAVAGFFLQRALRRAR